MAEEEARASAMVKVAVLRSEEAGPGPERGRSASAYSPEGSVVALGVGPLGVYRSAPIVRAAGCAPSRSPAPAHATLPYARLRPRFPAHQPPSPCARPGIRAPALVLPRARRVPQNSPSTTSMKLVRPCSRRIDMSASVERAARSDIHPHVMEVVRPPRAPHEKSMTVAKALWMTGIRSRCGSLDDCTTCMRCGCVDFDGRTTCIDVRECRFRWPSAARWGRARALQSPWMRHLDVDGVRTTAV